MDSKETIAWIAIGIVLLGIIYWVAQQQPSPGPMVPEEDLQKTLYLKALQVGYNASAYRYSYSEDLDGFLVNTTLVFDGQIRMAEFALPFARERFFLLENETIFCLTARGEERCADVQSISRMDNYVKVINNLFFQPLLIQQVAQHHERLIERGVISFTGLPLNRTINARPCTQVNFHYDIMGLTLADISALNIVPGSLRNYDAQWCIGEQGDIYEKTFSYPSGSQSRQTIFRLLEANWDYSEKIQRPDYTHNASVVDLFFRYADYQAELQGCYQKGAVERDRCVHSFAVGRNFVDLCDFADSRRDRCYISLALDQQNETLCGPIGNLSIRDDCYVEMAGQLQRSDLCNLLQNTTRAPSCVNISTSGIPEDGLEPSEDLEDYLINALG